LEAQYPGKVLEVRVTKVWFQLGRTMELWEVEGIVTLKAGLLKKEQRPFKYQIDPTTGEIVGFEG
jgi:hypothetical protein